MSPIVLHVARMLGGGGGDDAVWDNKRVTSQEGQAKVGQTIGCSNDINFTGMTRNTQRNDRQMLAGEHRDRENQIE